MADTSVTPIQWHGTPICFSGIILLNYFSFPQPKTVTYSTLSY